MTPYVEAAVPVRPDLFAVTWRHRARRDHPEVARVLPDGCADVLVDRSGRAVVVGPTLRTNVHCLRPGVELRGLRLHPWAVGHVLTGAATRLRDAMVALDDLVGGRSAERIAAAVWDARVPEAWLDRPVQASGATVVRTLLETSVEGAGSVSRAAGYSERQARRVTRSLSGLAPAELARLGRFRRFLDHVDDDAVQLAEAGLRAGFADQPHLSREVARLSGISPRVLRHERRGHTPDSPAWALSGTDDLLAVGGRSVQDGRWS